MITKKVKLKNGTLLPMYLVKGNGGSFFKDVWWSNPLTVDDAVNVLGRKSFLKGSRLFNDYTIKQFISLLKEENPFLRIPYSADWIYVANVIRANKSRKIDKCSDYSSLTKVSYEFTFNYKKLLFNACSCLTPTLYGDEVKLLGKKGDMYIQKFSDIASRGNAVTTLSFSNLCFYVCMDA